MPSVDPQQIPWGIWLLTRTLIGCVQISLTRGQTSGIMGLQEVGKSLVSHETITRGKAWNYCDCSSNQIASTIYRGILKVLVHCSLFWKYVLISFVHTFDDCESQDRNSATVAVFNVASYVLNCTKYIFWKLITAKVKFYHAVIKKKKGKTGSDV